MIDWDRVREMRGELGEAEFRLILELFLDEIETIAFRLTSNDPALMETDLHFLRGCSRNLGFRALAAVCEEFEALTISGRANEVRLERVLDIYAHTKQVFMRALAGSQAGQSPDAASKIKSGIRPVSGHG
ncbi:Hpt domain-containing protein [Paracoccus cavernae]